ncbi:MAG: tyrosine-type recombinase/integrase [Thermoanaerobaculia bacterium]|nr:tyrosine-type recombinase/integrase [Thermoanaerobaculia bacterium]
MLTDEFLWNFEAQGERQEVWDELVPGLGIRCSSRKKTWFLVYDCPKVESEGRPRQRRRLSLGDYPKKSLSQARTDAREFRDRLVAGLEPNLGMAEDRGGNLRFRDIAKNFLEKESKAKKTRFDNDASVIRTTLLPAFGDRSAGTITRREIREVLQAASHRGPSVPIQALVTLKRMFQWAMEEFDLPFNPASKVSWEQLPPRFRVLSSIEVRKIWEACRVPRAATDILLPLRLVTAQREVQLLSLRTSQLERDSLGLWWNVPAPNTKTRKPYRVFLSPLAEEVLARIEPDQSGAFFPKTSLRRSRVYAEPLRRIRMHVGTADWRPLDLRRTAATWMAQRGVPRFILKRVLGHADHDITAVYDLYSYDKEVRSAVLILERAIREAIGAPTSEPRSVSPGPASRRPEAVSFLDLYPGERLE